MRPHLPRLWRFRIAVKGRFFYHAAVFAVWAAWARAEGGVASYNPWNTTEPWPGAIDLPGNTAGVKCYPSGAAGVAATVATLRNGHYPHMVSYFRSPGKRTPRELVELCRADFDEWGTGAARVLAELPA